jgi:hypothetical protein
MKAELNQCCEQSGYTLTAYNIGRRITPLSAKLFAELQCQQQAYPYPLQRHAIFAMIIESAKSRQEPAFWCIKLPLDEQGKFNFAAVNQLAGILQQALSHVVNDAERESLLKNNPFAFAPSEQQLALLTAKIRADFELPASAYFEQVEEYFNGHSAADKWQTLPLQGIADYVVRLSEQAPLATRLRHFDALPQAVQEALAAAAEQVGITQAFADVSLHNLENNRSMSGKILALRTLLHTKQQPLLAPILNRLLQSDLANSVELHILLAGRAWELLQGELLQQFLENLSRFNDQTLFNSLLFDLFALPELRDELRQALRSPERSASLAQSIGNFFQILARN